MNITTQLFSNYNRISISLLLKVVFILILSGNIYSQSAGFNTTFIVLSINGGGNSYYDLQASTGNPDFNNASLGTFCEGNSTGIVFKGAEHNVYKCGGCDLSSTRIYYRIYPAGSPSGTYVSNSIGFTSGFNNGCGGQDQQWSNTGYSTNLLSGLSAGNYTIEVYSDATVTCSGGTVFASNSGNNYKANFTVNGTSIGGTVNGGITICSGSTSGLLTLTGNTGNIVRWESSVSPFSAWTTIANTSSTYTSTALTQTTKFRAVVKNGLCPEVNSTDTTVTVDPNVTASVSIAASPSGAICSGTSVTFTATPTNGGSPTYQWKINGTDVPGETNATFTSTTIVNNDVVTVVMTSTVTCVTGSPATSSGITMTVNPNPTLNTITATPACANTSSTVTLTGLLPSTAGSFLYTNSFTGPIQYPVSGTSDASGNFTFNTPPLPLAANGAIITIVSGTVTSTGCTTNFTGKTVTVLVNPNLPASVTIAASPSGAICSGTSVTYTATPTNGGSPTYQWRINGTDVPSETNVTFSTTSIANNDIVTVVMTSSLSCATGSPATSSGITMTVNPNLPASVSTTASPSGVICAGTSVTFTATPTNGGSPTYQWKINGTNVPGETNVTFTSTALANNDVVTVEMISNATCVTGSPATSSGITMTVNPNLPASVSTTASPSGAICAGTSVTFTATPTNGGSPTYQWKINGTNVSGETNATFTSSTLANNDVVTVEMTSNATCVTGSPAISSGITITVNPNVTASVNAAASPSGAICLGTSVTFTATPINGGSPTYQWKINGTDIPGETNVTFTSTTLANNDVVTVEMISNAVCVSGSPVTSSGITMIVNPNLPASVSIAASPLNTICAGTSVTFTATPTNGGTSPTFQWRINGSDVSGETNPTFTTTSLTNGNTVTVVMTSNAICATGSPATSNGITMSVSTLIDYINLQFPVSATICEGGNVTVFGQLFEPGVTPGSNSQGLGITAEFGYHTANTDPATWTNWSATTFNGLGGGVNNDEYMYTFSPPSSGTFYYTYRYKQGACDWQYGGYSGSGGGTWNGTTNVSGSVTVNILPTTSISSNNDPICNNTTATFNLAGTSGAILTYNINGGSNQTIVLTGGTATISVPNATVNQTLNLVSVSLGSCSATLSSSSTVNVGSVTTWNGTTWSNGVPTSTSAVVFTGNYTIGADMSVCTITVNSGAVVSITSGFNVTLNGAITVNTGSFTVNNNSNLIQTTNVANSGNIIVKRNSKALMRLDYTLWSSPVAGQKLQTFSPGTLANRFYTYTTSSNLYSVVASPSTTDFASGVGYLIRLPNAYPTTPTVWPGSFTGVPNNGTYTVPLTNIGVGQRFNAVGNPYPSAIDIDEFVADNASNITGTIYLWRKTNSIITSPGYCTWTAGTYVTNGEAQTVPNDASFVDILSTGQGFIVEASASGSSVEFNNSQRIVDNSNQFFRSQTIERNRMWLNLTNSTGDFYQMAMGYMTDATQGVDRFDGKYFNDGTMTLNSLLNNEKYVIQGRALPFNDTDVVPLTLTIPTEGSYTISIDHLDGFFDGDQRIFIKDKTNNSLYDLKENDFTFTSAAGTFNDRFEIVYRNPKETNIQTLCGQTLVNLNDNIFSTPVSGVQGYRFRVTNLTTNQVQTIDKTLRVFKLTQLPSFAYATEYKVEVAVKYNNVWQPYGNSCTITTPTVYGKIQNSYCGTTLTTVNDIILADIVNYAQGYRFRIKNTSNNSVSIINRPIRDIRLASIVNPEPNTVYSFEVAIKNLDGTYLPYGEICLINAPINDTGKVSYKFVNQGIFEVIAYPNPYSDNFNLEIISASESQVIIKVYDMTGRLVDSIATTVNDSTSLQLGNMYPTGVYNVVITQGENTTTKRLVRR